MSNEKKYMFLEDFFPETPKENYFECMEEYRKRCNTLEEYKQNLLDMNIKDFELIIKKITPGRALYTNGKNKIIIRVEIFLKLKKYFSAEKYNIIIKHLNLFDYIYLDDLNSIKILVSQLVHYRLEEAVEENDIIRIMESNTPPNIVIELINLKWIKNRIDFLYDEKGDAKPFFIEYFEGLNFNEKCEFNNFMLLQKGKAIDFSWMFKKSD